MGCCLGEKKYEYDFILNEFWQYQKITKIYSTEYINLILSNKGIFSDYNLNLKNLKEKFFIHLFDIENENSSRFYYESMKLIELFLDVSETRQFSLLISLMFFTKYEKFLDLYNNMKILFTHFSSQEFFKKGFENAYMFDYEFFKKLIINYYKIASAYTFDVIDKNIDEELNNHQEFVRKCFSNYMIETKLIDDIQLEENSVNLFGFFNQNPKYLNHKEIRIKLYMLYEENERKTPRQTL